MPGAGVRPPDGFSEVLETQGRQWLADAEQLSGVPILNWTSTPSW
ncbi:hypothetical protein AB0C38_49305 [Amycolatopsis sp. NPDC048633]